MAPRIKLVAFLLLAGLTALAGQRTPADFGLSSVMRLGLFVVHYDPADPFLARLAAETASDELARIADELGYAIEPEPPFDLYVYRSHRDFIEAGGLAKRKYTVGTARASDQSIAVDASGAFVVLREVLAHEIAHVVTFRILGHHAARLPLWFNEGMAKHYSGAASASDDALVAQAAAGGTLMPLRVLENDFPEKRESLAYAQSASAVRFMIRTSGASSPRVVLAELARGRSFDQAMVQATGLTSRQFSDEWYAYVSERYRMLRMIRIGGAVVGVVMAVLAVAAFSARRRRMREAARRWEEEELDEAIRRQIGNDWLR